MTLRYMRHSTLQERYHDLHTNKTKSCCMHNKVPSEYNLVGHWDFSLVDSLHQVQEEYPPCGEEAKEFSSKCTHYQTKIYYKSVRNCSYFENGFPTYYNMEIIFNFKSEPIFTIFFCGNFFVTWQAKPIKKTREYSFAFKSVHFLIKFCVLKLCHV